MAKSKRVEFKPLNGSHSDQSEDEDEIDEDQLAGHSRIVYKKFQLLQDIDSDKKANDTNRSRLLRIYIIALIIIILILANWNYPFNVYLDDKAINITTSSGSHFAKIISINPEPFSPPLTAEDKGLLENTTKKLSANTASPWHRPKSVVQNQIYQKAKLEGDILSSNYSSQHGNSPPGEYAYSNDLDVGGSTIQRYNTYMDTVLQERNNIVNKPNQLDDLRVHPNERYNIVKWWTVGFRDESKYVTITNYIRAIKLFDRNNSVTFSTQASADFLHHTVEICKRWDGPISVAVFATGSTLNNAVTVIKFMRDCLPSPLSSCIKDKVSWHLIYESKTGPSPDMLGYPKQHLNYVNYKPFAIHDECPKMASQDSKQMIKEFSESLANVSNHEPHHLYPINVLRNVARLASTTQHLLACDIELYPSVNLVPLFNNYMKRHNPSDEYNAKRYIFALPIFELKANATPPKTKIQLARLFTRGEAIFFHKFVCDYCQDFPNREDWIKSLNRTGDDELSIFAKTQRDKSRNSWEPIFIGTNEDPLYDDRLTWDGRRDKMGQMYEMCLLDYYVLIVDNAFLVHSPGIKHIDKADVMNRIPYIMNNNKIYESRMAQLKKTYANNETITKC